MFQTGLSLVSSGIQDAFAAARVLISLGIAPKSTDILKNVGVVRSWPASLGMHTIFSCFYVLKLVVVILPCTMH
jgi:hypothetical protein